MTTCSSSPSTTAPWECEECYSVNVHGDDCCELCCTDRAGMPSSASPAISTCSSPDREKLRHSGRTLSPEPPLAGCGDTHTRRAPGRVSSLHIALQNFQRTPQSSHNMSFLASAAPAAPLPRTGANLRPRTCKNCEAKFFSDTIKPELQHFCGADCLWSARFRQQDEERVQSCLRRFARCEDTVNF